jgi:hypothetical protein
MRKVPGAVRRTTQALGVAASAGLVLATLGATAANAFPMETGASECTTGTVVGDHVVYQAPPGKYVRDNMTLTEAASAAREAKFQAQLAKMVAAGVEGKKTTKIPVSFHVIRSGTAESQGNLPQAKIDAQIAQMNKAYAGNESGPGVKTGFKFVLKNVTRTTNSTWYNGADPQSQIERQMKTALHEGDYGTLNIYTTNLTDTTGGILGYAYYPEDQVGVLDGLVMERRTVPGGGLPPYDGGDTATHEIGHWLGLAHTFENGCNPPGDRVEDTPYESDPDFDCGATTPDSCAQPGKDPVHNYMDYGDDDCLDQFTAGQKQRMKAEWKAWRA